MSVSAPARAGDEAGKVSSGAEGALAAPPHADGAPCACDQPSSGPAVAAAAADVQEEQDQNQSRSLAASKFPDVDVVLGTMPLPVLPLAAWQQIQQLGEEAAAAGLQPEQVYDQLLLPLFRDMVFVVSNCRGLVQGPLQSCCLAR